MTVCPKCGSNRIAGPKFMAGEYGISERLLYTCFQCGYKTTTPTKDAKP